MTIDLLLRDRIALYRRIAAGDDLPGLARTMLATVLCGGLVFGAVLGGSRGGAQIAFAAIKLPLVILMTAAVCAPALTALNAAVGRPSEIKRDLALVLSALALGSLTLAAQAPLVLLATLLEARYHMMILLAVGCCTMAGVATVVTFHTGLGVAQGNAVGARVGREVVGHAAGLPERRGTVWFTVVALFALVGAQMAWVGRPYLVRPREPGSPPFVRPLEGSLFDAVSDTSRSARGIYTRESAPVRGEEE
jgi:hypothetical protein